MISIYYNKNTLQDAMIVSIDEKKITDVIHNDNYSLIYSENEIIGINIFNVSRLIDLPEGFLFPDEKIINFIKKVTSEPINFNQEKVNFVVGLVTACEPIVNTRLHKCQVEIDNKQAKQIVCGAQNVRVGIKVVVVTPGSFLPNGSFIKPNKIMNLDSFGMICSANELNLKNHKFNEKGILELSQEYLVGDCFKAIYNN